MDNEAYIGVADFYSFYNKDNSLKLAYERCLVL